MKPGARLGKDPLNRPAGTNRDDVLRTILDPAAPALPPLDDAPERDALHARRAGERFTKALSAFMGLAVRAGLSPEDQPRDSTMLLLIRLVGALRLTPQGEVVDLGAYVGGVSGPWSLRIRETHPLVPPRCAMALALGLSAITHRLRADGGHGLGPLILGLERSPRGTVALRLYGPPEAFPQDPSDPRADGLKTLALRGLLSMRSLTAHGVREVRLDVPESL